MINQRKALWMVIAITTLSSHLNAMVPVVGGLSTGFAASNFAKDLSKLDYNNARENATQVTMKTAITDSIIFALEYRFGGKLQWLRHSAKFTLYYDVLKELEKAWIIYQKLPIAQALTHDAEQPLSIFNWVKTNVSNHPLELQAFGYFALGFVNGWASRIASDAFMGQLLPAGIPSYPKNDKGELTRDIKAFDLNELHKLSSIFVGTFGSNLTKQYFDGVAPQPENQAEKDLLNAMYGAGLRAYFTLEPLHNTWKDMHIRHVANTMKNNFQELPAAVATYLDTKLSNLHMPRVNIWG
jgi:hypothetical protein